MAFDPAQFTEDVTVSEEQIRQYYESRESEFNKGKEVKASHILLRIPNDADADAEAEIKQKAEDIVQQLKDGADFAELAALHSEDPGSAEQGGDLGFFSKGMMVPEFEEAAFALEPGAFSEPVRSQFGYHIIQVDEVREDADPYATAKPIIEDRLKLEQAKTLAEERADAAYQQALDSRDFQQVAEGADAEMHESQFFARGEPIDDDLSVNWQIQNVALTLNTDERFSPPIETATGFYVIEFLESQEPYIPELEEIIDDVTESLRQDKANELAQAKAQEIKNALDAGAEWATVAEEEPVELLAPEPFSRRQQYITEFPGDTESVIKTAFALQAGETSAPLDLSDQYAIIRLVEKLGIDNTAFVEEKATLTQSVLAQKQNTVFDEFVDELRQQADILVSELLQG
jgi:peptidyl-prolyl cis-trans isomerase D